jgi:hypothetical protein
MQLQEDMSSNEPGEENVKTMPPSNTDSVDNTNIGSSEKMVELVHSSKVKVMTFGVKDFINVDIKNLDEGTVYHVEYQDNAYGVEKLSDGKITIYEVVD